MLIDFYWDEANFFLFFLKKNQNGRLKKTEFFNSPNSQYSFAKNRAKNAKLPKDMQHSVLCTIKYFFTDTKCNWS